MRDQTLTIIPLYISEFERVQMGALVNSYYFGWFGGIMNA